MTEGHHLIIIDWEQQEKKMPLYWQKMKDKGTLSGELVNSLNGKIYLVNGNNNT